MNIIATGEILSPAEENKLKRQAVFRHASELGMLLGADKADIREAILSVLSDEQRDKLMSTN